MMYEVLDGFGNIYAADTALEAIQSAKQAGAKLGESNLYIDVSQEEFQTLAEAVRPLCREHNLQLIIRRRRA